MCLQWKIQDTSHNKNHLPMNNMLNNIPFMKLCALQLMHHFSGLLFYNIDDIFPIKNEFMVLGFNENEWKKIWVWQTYFITLEILFSNIYVYYQKKSRRGIILKFHTLYLPTPNTHTHIDTDTHTHTLLIDG